MFSNFTPPTASTKRLSWLHDDKDYLPPLICSWNYEEPGSPSDFINHIIPDAVPSASRKRYEPLHGPYPIVNSNSDGQVSNSEAERSVGEVKPKKRGRPIKNGNINKVPKKKHIRLPQFLKKLLNDPETCPSLIKWVDQEEGTFKFVQKEDILRRWSQRRENGSEANYEHFTRGMRYYYKRGILQPVTGIRLVYKFGENAKGW